MENYQLNFVFLSGNSFTVFIQNKELPNETIMSFTVFDLDKQSLDVQQDKFTIMNDKVELLMELSEKFNTMTIVKRTHNEKPGTNMKMILKGNKESVLKFNELWGILNNKFGPNERKGKGRAVRTE